MMFHIYDENGDLIGTKRRDKVHQDGDWHKGVQLNIFYNNEILIQQRSAMVDIAKGCFDQSLAVQLVVEDNKDERIALKRGLKEELGLEELKFEKVAGPHKISKTYDYDPRIRNNEFVTLYEARLSSKPEIIPVNNKVSRVFWKDYGEVKKEALAYPHLYTKTFLMWLLVT